MKRLLLISPFARPDQGGVESHLFKLINYLQKKNITKVSLISYRPLNKKIKYQTYIKDNNIEYIKIPWFGIGLFRKFENFFPMNFVYLFPGLFIVSSLFYFRHHSEVKVIHAHGLIAASIGMILKKIKKVKLIVSTHAVYGLEKGTIKSLLFKTILSNSDKILAVGEPSRDELIKIGLPLSLEDIHKNWVDLEFYKPLESIEIKKRYCIDESKRVCLFVGRMIEIKGELLLLEIAKKINNDVLFIFVGDGPTKNIIKSACTVNQNIKLLDNIPDSEMPAIYNMADVFVSPVLYEEGFATVYLESLACGVPIVTAKRGCLPYFLSDEIGILIENKITENKLINAINTILEKNVNREMGKICRNYAEKNFSELNAERILNEY